MVTESKHEDSKQRRLIKMRECQKRLKERRKKEVEDMRKVMLDLSDENILYKEEKTAMIKEQQAILEMFSEEITVRQFSMLIGISTKSFAPPTTSIKTVSLDEHIDKMNYRIYPWLFVNGSFMIRDICYRVPRSLPNAYSPMKTLKLSQSPMKYLSDYGLLLFGNCVNFLTLVAVNNAIPVSWTHTDLEAPDKHMSILNMVDYLVQNVDHTRTHTDVLSCLLTKFLVSTNSCLFILENDVANCVQLALEGNFEQAYSTGTLDHAISLQSDFDRYKELYQEPQL